MAKKTSKEKQIQSRICIKLKDGKEKVFNGLEVESVELIQDAFPIKYEVINKKQLFDRIFTYIINSGSSDMPLLGTVLHFDHMQKECNCTRLDLLQFCEEYQVKCGYIDWGEASYEGLLVDKKLLKRAIKILEEKQHLLEVEK